MLSLFTTPIASSYSLVGRGLCTDHDAPLSPYVRSFHPFNILDADYSGNKDAVTAGLAVPMDGGALAKALCDSTPDCGYVVFYVNAHNQYEAQNYFIYHKNVTLDLTPDSGLAECDGDPVNCNQPECLKREEDECTICPESVDIFDECPSLPESACDANPNCGWCSDHCRVSCTCNDDETTSLFQACDYNSDGEPTTVVERWPRVIHISLPLIQKRWAPECTCGHPTGWVLGPSDHIEVPDKVRAAPHEIAPGAGPNGHIKLPASLAPREWFELRAWLAQPPSAILAKFLGWSPGEDAQPTDGGKADVSKAHYVGEDEGLHGGVAAGNPGQDKDLPAPPSQDEIKHPNRESFMPCTPECMDHCEPINPAGLEGDPWDEISMRCYCGCLQACGCGQNC